MGPADAGRRDFLKAASGAALTTSLFTGDLRGANDRVNLAFIGLGRMGSGNIGYSAKVPGCQITDVCAVNKTKWIETRFVFSAINATM